MKQLSNAPFIWYVCSNGGGRGVDQNRLFAYKGERYGPPKYVCKMKEKLFAFGACILQCSYLEDDSINESVSTHH